MRPAFWRRRSAMLAGAEADPAPWHRGFCPARHSSSTYSRFWKAPIKRPTGTPVGPCTLGKIGSGSQLPQHIAVLLLQLPKRSIAELTNTLTGYSHHPADLFQSPAVAVIQTEIQPEHLGIARRQSGQRQLEIVGPAARQGRGVGPFLRQGNEPVQPTPVLALPDRLVETQGLYVKRTQRAHRFRRQPRSRNQLLGGGHAPQ